MAVPVASLPHDLDIVLQGWSSPARAPP
jgi:hypothetical protein